MSLAMDWKGLASHVEALFLVVGLGDGLIMFHGVSKAIKGQKWKGNR
jgi:hypothetical protein